VTVSAQKPEKAAGTKAEKNDTGQQIPKSISLTLISINAALYTVAIAATSFIQTPWGIGNFRPGVVIPALFSVVFGPFVGGMGAAIGCFLGDFALSFFGLTTPLLSLVAGVPGNFVGFYFLGWLVSRYRSWSSFVYSSFVSLFVGNLIAALGVVGFNSYVIPIMASWPMDVKIGTILGFTFFWVATMIPFVIPLTPPLLRAIKPLLGASGGNFNTKEVTWGKPAEMLKSTIIVFLVLVALYAIVIYSPLGDLIFSKVIYAEATSWVKTFILISSFVIMVFGIVTVIFLRQKKNS
jgi:uncharacterized membrane protein